MERKIIITDDILWDYADGLMVDPDKTAVEALLRQHPEWQARLQAIEQEKQELFSLPMEAPDPGFADRVLAAWAVEQVKIRAESKGNDWIIRGIAFVFGLFILTPLVVMVFAATQLAPVELPTFTLPEIPAVDPTPWLNNPFLAYGLLLILVFTALRFLDKYLQHRRLAQELGY